jgi:integrase
VVPVDREPPLKTGIRQGELGGLRWQDVDLEQAVIRVRRTTQAATSVRPNRERRDVDLIKDVVESSPSFNPEEHATNWSFPQNGNASRQVAPVLRSNLRSGFQRITPAASIFA